MKGNLSLENILHTNNDISKDTIKLESESNDPIRRGLVSCYIATSLFHGFVLQHLVLRDMTFLF
jgi:hypothetical protein